jgi:exosortase/archaeosortase
MRKISWRLASCYYPYRVHSHIALARYTQVGILYVFCLFVTVHMSVALTSSSPGIRTVASGLLFYTPFQIRI